MPIGKSRSSGTKASTSRSLSTPSMYNGSMVDKKTRQNLFFECHVCILGRTKISKDESYSENKAEVLMNRQYNKRQSHCILFCLEDCIRFAKSKKCGIQPFRNYVKYKFIKHVFIFQEKPDAFMLCIDSGRSDKRTYEAFKCKQQEDVATICELIFKASKDHEFILRDLIPIKNSTRYPELSSSLTNRYSTNEIDAQSDCVRSLSAIGTGSPHSLAVLNVFNNFDEHEKNIFKREFNGQQQENSVLIEEPVPRISRTLIYEIPNRRAPAIKVETDGEYLISQEMDEKLAFREKLAENNDDEWEVNITYLQWDNLRGATINDRGPIYMYVARHLHPNN